MLTRPCLQARKKLGVAFCLQVVFAIVGVSLLPLLFEAIAARREGKLATASVEGKIAGNKIAAAEETKQNEGLA